MHVDMQSCVCFREWVYSRRHFLMHAFSES